MRRDAHIRHTSHITARCKRTPSKAALLLSLWRVAFVAEIFLAFEFLVGYHILVSRKEEVCYLLNANITPMRLVPS